MFVITHAWIHAHRTGRGGWTRRQLEAIGVAWPPTHGWVTRTVGRAITEDQRATFECSTQVRTAPLWTRPTMGAKP